MSMSVLGITWLCPFSLLVHSFSKRHKTFPILPFSLRRAHKIGAISGKKAHRHQIVEQYLLCIIFDRYSGWNCQPWPSRSQNWMFVHSIIILSRSQQFPTSSSQNQVELGEWATGHFMHCRCIVLVIVMIILKKKIEQMPSGRTWSGND